MKPPGAVSPTSETIQAVEIPLVATSRGANAIALTYTARPVYILGESTCAPITFLSVDQSSPTAFRPTC